MYVASGGSDDWAYGTAGIKYSHCIELRPGQTGTDSAYGFQLPESRLIIKINIDDNHFQIFNNYFYFYRAPLAGEETYVGIKAFLNSIKP